MPVIESPNKHLQAKPTGGHLPKMVVELFWPVMVDVLGVSPKNLSLHILLFFTAPPVCVLKRTVVNLLAGHCA